MANYKTKRTWKKNFEKTFSAKTRNQIHKKIKKSQKTKEGLTSVFLNSILKKINNFVGVIPQDYLEKIRINSFPTSFVVNSDLSNQLGDHWLAVFITSDKIFIFDSLGFHKHKWPFLLQFLTKYKKTHRFYQTPQVQQPFNYTCGFYCIYFLISCQYTNYKTYLSLFSGDFNRNDHIILDLFSK